MKLLRMTATFGRLEQETLSLTDGLNVLQMRTKPEKVHGRNFCLPCSMASIPPSG